VDADRGQDAASELRPRPPFWSTVRRAVRESWDYLGTVLFTSALVMLAFVFLAIALAYGLMQLAPPPAPVPRSTGGAGTLPARSDAAAWLLLGLSFLIAASAIGPLLAGVHGLVRRIVARDDPGLTDLFHEARARAPAAVALAALQTGLVLLLWVDLLFFGASPLLPLKGLAALCFYALLLWGLMLPYQWPLLVEGAGSPLRVVKKSFLLVLDNLPFTIGVALLTLLFSLLCAITTVGMVLLWTGSLAFFHTVATRALLRKYGLLPAEPEPDASLEATVDEGG
jgi:hypothetical protein